MNSVPEKQMKKSYATFSVGHSWHQVRHAWQERKRAERNMTLLYKNLSDHERRMERKIGKPLQGLRMLEIGPGQGMERSRYFGLRNEVITLDLDVIPQGLELDAYYRMLRDNGAGRFFKTLGRKLIVGRANAAAWSHVVGSNQMKAPQRTYGDVCQSLPDVGCFDVVMSWSVFEHLSDPQRALENIIASLRPGGIFYISLHLYTSNNGHHDIRAFTGAEAELPLWGHLRSSTRHLVKPSSYLNEWRLAQWRDLFSAFAPGVEEHLESHNHREKYWSQVTPLIRQELERYSEEELLTVDAIYLWQKPLS